MKYVPDHKGVAALALDVPMSKAMVNIAMDGARIAQRLSPVKTGEYFSSFAVRPMRERAGWKNELRAGAAIENNSSHALAVEYQNKSFVLNRTRAILDSSRRAGKAAGGRRSKPSGASW